MNIALAIGVATGRNSRCSNIGDDISAGSVPTQNTDIRMAPFIGLCVCEMARTYVYSHPQGKKIDPKPINPAYVLGVTKRLSFIIISSTLFPPGK